MSAMPKYYLIAAEALPEIYRKVAEAKRLVETGEAPTAQAAVRQAGISRSAYYKYKDSISPFYDMAAGKIVTFNVMLKDKPGVLSSVLSIFADSGANILTMNQSIPSNGCAAVTVSAETSQMHVSVSELLQRASEATGVVKMEVLAG